MGRHAPCLTYWFDGGVYLVEVHGRLTAASLSPAIDALYADPRTLNPHAVVFAEGPGCDYDRSVLSFHQHDVPRPMPALVGVVARRPVARMVASAAGLGFRTVTGVPFRVYDDLIGALVDGRVAVSQAV